jgi:hypothetical protein
MVELFFDSLSVESYLSGSILIALFVICGQIGFILCCRLLKQDSLKQFHDVAGNMFGVCGTLYAVLLGLLVVDAMQTFQSARRTAEKEADALATIFILAERLPQEKMLKVQALSKSYATRVVDIEWPMMNHGLMDPKSRNLSLQLLREINDFEPKTESQKTIYAQLVQEVLDMREHRRDRSSMVSHSIAAVEWVVLGVGAIITVVFTYFFRLQSLRVQQAMIGMISLIIALNIYLMVLFGYPYSGDLHVNADRFRMNLKLFDNPD